MKLIHETISGCHDCPYMENLAGGCLECGGDMAFDFRCCKVEDYKEIANEINRSLIKREWTTGKFNNIHHFEIEIPSWCPLADAPIAKE